MFRALLVPAVFSKGFMDKLRKFEMQQRSAARSLGDGRMVQGGCSTMFKDAYMAIYYIDACT